MMTMTVNFDSTGLLLCFDCRFSFTDFIGPGDKNKKTRQTKSTNPPPVPATTSSSTRPPPRKRKEQSVRIRFDDNLFLKQFRFSLV